MSFIGDIALEDTPINVAQIIIPFKAIVKRFLQNFYI